MNKPLAIVAPRIGARSETFIQRHMQNLLPEGSVVVTAYNPSTQEDWDVSSPKTVMNWMHRGGYREQLLHYSACVLQPVVKPLLGWQPADRRWVPVKKFLQAHQVSVIMGEYLDFCFPWIRIAKELNIPFYCHAHGYDVSYNLKQSVWRRKYLAYNQTGGIITMSQFSRSRLLDIGLDPAKVYVAPYGVNVSPDPPQKTVNSKVRCLAVGRMTPKKAPLKTLESFRQALESFSELHLDFIGGGELLPEAEAFVREYSLGDYVTLHGPQPNTVAKNFFQEADIFLQHSVTNPSNGDQEGLPVAILEAMAFGLPVVSTRHAGIPEAVMESETGLLVEEGDVKGMCDRIIELATQPKQRQVMGYQGWQRAKQYFSWEQERYQLLKILGLESP